MTNLEKNLFLVNQNLPKEVELVAVSKTKPVSLIQEAYDLGHRAFGENKIQELVEKYEQLPKDIEWHMIGHLQRNKVKYIAPFIELIHGVDSFKTLKEINKQALKNNRIINCLLQIKIASEDTKFGLTKTELISILNSSDLTELNNIQIKGLMGMATFTKDTNQINNEFNYLNTIFKEVKNINFKNINIKILSMGMSGDYQIAIKNGSNMIRVGSSIFGKR